MSNPKTPAEQAQVDAEVRPETKPPAGPPPPTEAPAAAPVAAAKAEPTTPEYWARKLGHVGKPSPLDINGQKRGGHFDIAHAAADQLHGWSFHAQNTVDPLVLSQADYEAALKAALEPQGGHYVPHSPALSPFARKRAEERAKRRAAKQSAPKGGE